MKTTDGKIVSWDDLPPPRKHVIPRLDVKDYCGSWAWVNVDGDRSPFFCGSASCGRKECKKAYWQKRIRIISCLIEEHNLNKFFTLTLDHKKVKEYDAWEQIPHIWSKMRRRLGRAYPGFKFVAVLEQHKENSYPHIHGFTNTWIPQKEWSDAWVACGGGPIVDVRAVTGKVDEYVNKELHAALYVGKDNLLDAKSRLQDRQRSFWRSTKMKASFELDKSPAKWVVLKQHVFKEVTNGKESSFMERACGTVFAQSSEASLENMEAEIKAPKQGEDFQAPKTARQNQRADQEREE